MQYIINSIRQENEIVITNTTITLDNGTILTLDISHFMPQNIEDIKLGITNRAISEQAKLDTINDIKTLIDIIPINQNITI